MKKIQLICGTALFAATVCIFVCVNKQNKDADLFRGNVEALSDTESGLWGTCADSFYECQGKCPHCGKLIYASGHNGRITKLWGTCNNCHNEVNVSY